MWQGEFGVVVIGCGVGFGVKEGLWFDNGGGGGGGRWWGRWFSKGHTDVALFSLADGVVVDVGVGSDTVDESSFLRRQGGQEGQGAA